MSKLSHVNERGEAAMVNVGGKPVTHRIAVAEGVIRMQPATLGLIVDGAVAKGDVLGTARIAGIMAAKKTAELVPLCHPLAIRNVDIRFETRPEANVVHCTARVEAMDQTGVEMEALNAVQVALLTVYDMCKAVDRGMTIDGVRLLEKRGGKSGDWSR